MKDETILFKMRKRKRKGKSFKSLSRASPSTNDLTLYTSWLLLRLFPILFPIPLWLSSDYLLIFWFDYLLIVVVFICFVLGFLLLFGAFKTGSHSPGWPWTCCYLAQDGQELLLLLSLLPKYHRTWLSDYFFNVTVIFRFFVIYKMNRHVNSFLPYNQSELVIEYG